MYDGTGQTAHTTGDSTVPPYDTGLDALLDRKDRDSSEIEFELVM